MLAKQSSVLNSRKSEAIPARAKFLRGLVVGITSPRHQSNMKQSKPPPTPETSPCPSSL